MRCDFATIRNRLPDRHQPRRRSGVRGHPQPVRDAQPFAQDVPRVIVSGGVPVHQQPHHRRPVYPQPRRQVRGQFRRPARTLEPQPAPVGRVRGQFDPGSPKGHEQRGEAIAHIVLPSLDSHTWGVAWRFLSTK